MTDVTPADDFASFLTASLERSHRRQVEDAQMSGADLVARGNLDPTAPTQDFAAWLGQATGHTEGPTGDEELPTPPGPRPDHSQGARGGPPPRANPVHALADALAGLRLAARDGWTDLRDFRTRP